jgi:phenylalanyl-tRNA synthetase beta chain
MERALRWTARALGYDETISITLTAAAETQRFSPQPPVALNNPLSAESAVLRTSILPGLLESVARNLNRGVLRVRLFESGKIYRRAAAGYDEPPVFGLAATGDVDFYQLKGDVESLLDLFACPAAVFEAGDGSCFHPGRSARALLEGEEVVRFGELHPDAAGHYGFRQPVLAAEFWLAGLYRRGLRAPAHQTISRFPAVDRDFSVLLPEGVLFARVEAAVRALNLPDLQEVWPAEVYRGEGIPAGQYSLLLRVRFQSSERTLSDAEVNDHAAAIIEALKTQAGAVLRA